MFPYRRTELFDNNKENPTTVKHISIFWDEKKHFSILVKQNRVSPLIGMQCSYTNDLQFALQTFENKKQINL